MANVINKISGNWEQAKGNRQTTSYNVREISTENDSDVTSDANWGERASRSLYNVFANQNDTAMSNRSLLNSRLWHGVPQLTIEQMNMFEAAYTGHTFIFVVDVPKFMTIGLYKDKNLHHQMKNLKAVIERASTGFTGFSPITANFDTQNDGNGRKIDHVTSITKEQGDISLTLHEFAGLPVKNALEAWMTGTYDYKSEHGHYFGNLGIPGGWCLANHTMSILVVQVDPSWQTIQDAAFYYNMFPNEVPFDHFEWTKGEHTIVSDYQISFKCNEERSPMIMYAAERYMNNRILSMVATSVYNSRQFVVHDFGGKSPLDYSEFASNLQDGNKIIDDRQYNIDLQESGGVNPSDQASAVEEYETQVNNKTNMASLNMNKYYNDKPLHAIDKTTTTETTNPW